VKEWIERNKKSSHMNVTACFFVSLQGFKPRLF
jgi:hypothetical protein